MAIALVQSVNTNGSATCTLPGGTGAGSTVFYVVYAYDQSGATITASGPAVGGSAYPGAAQVLSGLSPGTNDVLFSLWMFPGLPAGATAFSVTVANGNVDSNVGSSAWEFSGLGPAPAVDVLSNGSGTAGSLSSGTTAATRYSPELVLGAAVGFAVTLTPPGSPWTGTLQASGFCSAGYQVIAGPGGTYSYAPSGSGNDWAAGVVTVAPAQPAVPPPAVLLVPPGFQSPAAFPFLPQPAPPPAVVAVPAAAALSGSGALAAAGLVTQPAAAALSGTGALAAAGPVSFTSGAALSGSGSLAAAGQKTVPGAAALSGSGTLAAAAAVAFAPAVALGGSGALGAGPAVAFAPVAGLSGSGTLTAPRSVQFPGAAVLAGTGALAAAEAVSSAVACALSGTGVLAAQGLVTQPAAAALSGSGAMPAGAAVQFTSAAALAGSGSLAVAALVTQPAGGSLSGSGSLAVAASLLLAAAPALSGTGTLTAAGAVSGLSQGGAALSGSGAVSAGPLVQFAGSAALAGAGTFSAAALAAVPAAAALSGTGLLAAAAGVAVPASAALSGQGVITAAAVASVPSGAALSGTGSLSAAPVPAFAASASLSGLGALTALARVILPVTEPPVLWSAQPAALRWRAAPAPPRWTVTPSPVRWRVAMALFPPIAAISLEEVNVTWESSLAGTSVDPTGQSTGQPALPVHFAFPQTSGNYSEPAQPATWFTGSWLLGGTSIGYTAQCLVGPGGVVTLTAGLAYDVFGKILGSPESPVKFAGTIQVY